MTLSVVALTAFNTADAGDAERDVTRCCGSTAFVTAIVARDLTRI